MKPIISILAVFVLLFSACKKEEKWEENLHTLEGIWKVAAYEVNGINLPNSDFANMRFNFEVCDLPKYHYCNGYFTNNQGEEFLFAYSINDAANQLEIKFGALQYDNILAQWQGEKKKHRLTFSDQNGNSQIITLNK